MKILLFLLTLLSFSLHGGEIKPKITAKSAILIDGKTGEILFEKNAYDRFFPASLTKIATVYYALETISDIYQYTSPSENALKEIKPERKHQNYEVKPYILENDGTKMYGLKPNKKVLFKDLLFGAMLASGNNAANVIAEAISGDISNFMNELNVFFTKNGLKSTYFKNPHGLHFPGHYSSAYDLAILTKKALKNPIFRKIVKSSSYKLESMNSTLKQNNLLIAKDSKYYYPKAIGVKTGYTSKSGYNIVAAAEDSNHSFIGVALGYENSTDRYKDIAALFDAFFSEEIKNEVIFSVNQVFEKEIATAKDVIKVTLNEDLSVSYYPSRKPNFEAFIEWTNVSLPIKKGQIVGNLIVKDNNLELARAKLYSQNEVRKNFYKWLFNLIF